MYKYLLLTLFVMITACSGNPLKGRISKGLYYSASGEYLIEVPYFKGLQVNDGVKADVEWVDFQYGCCDWANSGGYSLEWMKISDPPENFGQFINRADDLIRAHIKHSIDNGSTFSTIKQRSFALNGKQAKQVIGRITKDSLPAIYAATVVNYSNRFAVGVVMYPTRGAKGNYRDYSEWSRYVRFMKSLDEI